MPELDTAHLKRMFKMSAKGGRKLYYAFGQGKTIEDSDFIVHKTMKGKALVAEMGDRKQFSRVAYGTLTASDTAITLTEQKVNGKIEKWLPKMLKKAAVRYKVAMAVPGEGAAAGAGGEGAAAPRAERIGALERELDELLSLL